MEDEGSTKTLIRVLRSRERAMQHVARPSAIDRDGAINERATNSSRKASRARTDKIADRERRAAFASGSAGYQRALAGRRAAGFHANGIERGGFR